MSLMCVAVSGLWGVPGPRVLQQEAALRSPGDEYLPGIASEFGACATFLVLFLWRRINDQLPRSTYFQASWKVYCTGAVLFFMFILAQLSWGLFESQMIRVGYRFHFVPPSHQLIPGAEVPVPVAAGA